MKSYPIELEVSGPLAMFSRPDTGAAPTSYPAPTWSAAKGILEAIAYLSDGEAWFHPTHIEICRHRDHPGGALIYQRYATNYGGPLRKEQSIRNDTSMQIFANVLANVCYRIHAEVRGTRSHGPQNQRHYLQNLFLRRLKQGRCYRAPCLGLSEFACDYWGASRSEWHVDTALNLEIPSMLASVWDKPSGGSYVSRFAQKARITGGVLHYAE